MKMKMAPLLKKYGVDIEVWPADALKGNNDPEIVDGIPVKKATASVEPEHRHEPIVPYSTFTQQWMLAAGGNQSNFDLMWFSTKLYPQGTVLNIPSQGGKYRVTDIENLLDYSDVVGYQLKGDDHNQSNL